jgi:hypothetical protein
MRHILVSLLVLILQGCTEAVFNISAPAGEFQELLDDKTPLKGEYTIYLQLNSAEKGTKWAASIATGFYENNKYDSIQFFIWQNEPEDETLSVGYRYLDKGIEKEFTKLFGDVKFGDKVKFKIKWDGKGNYNITIDDKVNKEVKTDIIKATAYFSVASGSGELRY